MVCILEETMTSQIHSEFNWPLEAVNLPSFLWVTGEGTGGAGGGLTGFLLLSISNGMGPTAMNPIPRITLSSGLKWYH